MPTNKTKSKKTTKKSKSKIKKSKKGTNKLAILRKTRIFYIIFILVFGAIGVWLLNDSSAATRDPWERPFAHDSIWNTPIGSNAKYVDAGFPFTAKSQLDKTYFLKLKSSDPVRDYVITGGWKDRCSGTQKTGIQLNLPNGFLIPDAHLNSNGSWSTPNNGWEFLLPDGKTVISSGGGARCSGTGPIFGHGGKTHFSIYGDGISGGHGGSGLTRLGGAIRGDDLSGNEPIRHALDLVLYSKYFYSDNKTTKESTYRWPASRSDAYSLNKSKTDRYIGTNPETRMGSLLALKPNVKPSDLNIKSKEGLKLFHAMQDWGGYITDDSAWDANTLTVDANAVGTFSWGSQQKEEFGRIIDAAHVVTNNSPSSIGGGGTPRVQGHAPFGQEAPAPQPSPTPEPTPTTSPSNPSTDADSGNYISKTGNYTTGKSITSSSNVSGTFTAQKAVDGDETTNESRWISDKKDGEWLQIDLGNKKDVKRISILWAGNTTKNYNVSVSNDGSSFTQAASGTTDNNKFTGREHDINKQARYVRITGVSRWNNDWGNSIREVGVYANTITQTDSGSDGTTSGSPPKTGGSVIDNETGIEIEASPGTGAVNEVSNPSDANDSTPLLTGRVKFKTPENSTQKKYVERKIHINGRKVASLKEGESLELDTSTFNNGEYELEVTSTTEDGSTETKKSMIKIENDLNPLEKARNFVTSPIAGKYSGRTLNIAFGTFFGLSSIPVSLKLWPILLRRFI